MTHTPVHEEALLEGATCLNCGYALRGLGQARKCPECGRPFDPADLESFDGPMRAVQRLRRALHWAPIAVWAATVGVLLIGSYFLAVEFRWDFFQLLWRAPSLLFMAVLVLSTLARGRARRALLGKSPDLDAGSERLFRIGIGAACVAFLFVPDGVRQWSCPHGTGFGIGPVGIAHSTVGGPCRNTVNHQYAWRVVGPSYAWAELD